MQEAIEKWETLLRETVNEAFADHDDGAHDFAHIARVWQNCRDIATGENACDWEVLIAAAYLHDIVSLPKNSPERHLASKAAAREARRCLQRVEFPQTKLGAVAHAIEVHSFSADIEPETLEAKILQDADRLDALGAIGIARTFYVGGKMSSALFHPTDPSGLQRALDDKAYALDHFAIKLYKIAETMKTTTGAKLAKRRIAFMKRFEAELLEETAW